MPLQTSVGQVLINAVLPQDLRDYNRILDKKGIQKLMTEVADKHPELYPRIAYDLARIASIYALRTGGYSPGLEDLEPPASILKLREKAKDEVIRILTSKKSREEKDKELTEYLVNLGKEIEELLFEEAFKRKNQFAMQVYTGSRGNKSNLLSLLFGPLIYQDAQGKPIVVPILSGYGSGLKSVQFIAGTFGAREGLVSQKIAVQEAGAISKQLIRVAHDLIVTSDDYEIPPPYPRGLLVSVDDEDNIGAVLAVPVDNIPAGTVLTPNILEQIKNKGIKEIIVRSPIASFNPKGGLYAKDVGVYDRGRLPLPGEYVGISAAQSIGELISQATICLAPETNVVMADGTYKPIEFIKEGDKVISLDEHGNFIQASVKAVYKTTVQGFWTVYVKSKPHRNSYMIKCTPEHKILCDDFKVKPLKDILASKSWKLFLRKPGTTLPFTNNLPTKTRSITHPLIVALLCTNNHTVELDENKLKSITIKLRTNIVPEQYKRLSETLTQQYKTQGFEYKPDQKTPKLTLKFNEPIAIQPYYKNYCSANKLNYWSLPLFCDFLHAFIPLQTQLTITTTGLHPGWPKLEWHSDDRETLEFVQRGLEFFFGFYTSRIYSYYTKKTGHYRYMFKLVGYDQLICLNDYVKLPYNYVKLLEAVDSAFNTHKNIANIRIYKNKLNGKNSYTAYDIEIDSPTHVFMLPGGIFVSNSQKHHGGRYTGKQSPHGTAKLLEAIINIPENFAYSVHAQTDGKVNKIEPSPQGGFSVYINNEEHYIPPHLDVVVSEGQTVEAGDMLTNGFPNPAEITKHKGIGEGRRYFIKALLDIMKSGGFKVHRKNAELLATAIVNHVELQDQYKDYMPGDIVPYNYFEATWEPRPESKEVNIKKALGKYIEVPVLHYSIGTRVTPSVISVLQRAGINTIRVHDEPPPFKPLVVRAEAALLYYPDWQTRLLGSYLEESLLRSVYKGESSDEAGISYVPSYIRAVEFSKHEKTKGFKYPRTVLGTTASQRPSGLRRSILEGEYNFKLKDPSTIIADRPGETEEEVRYGVQVQPQQSVLSEYTKPPEKENRKQQFINYNVQ